MEKMNETAGMKNRLMMSGVNKLLVHIFTRQNFWKCIGYIISAVTSGKKFHKLWIEIPKNILVIIHQLNYKEMFVGPLI